MPGGKVNSGLSSASCRRLELETGDHLLSADIRQKENILNRKPKLIDGGLILHWGQKKRPRLMKGTADRTTNISHSLNSTATIEVGSAERTQFQSIRWQPAVQSTGPAPRISTSCGIETAAEWANRTTEDPTASVNLAEERNRCADSSTPSDDSGKRSPSHKKEGKVSDSSNGDRVGKCHRRKELDSLHETPITDGNGISEPFRWPKFLISLSWKEKEDDFMAIKGAKLPQRPKRHSKKVERTLQYVCPGTFLCELNQDRYEVREKKTSKRKQRGLKVMDSVESDSD